MSDVNNKKYVWIVSYTLNNEPMVAAFEDKADAEICKKYFESKGQVCYIDEVELVPSRVEAAAGDEEAEG